VPTAELVAVGAPAAAVEAPEAPAAATVAHNGKAPRPPANKQAPPPAPTTTEETAPPALAGPSSSANDRTVRVDVELLDTLMRQVGELVLARNQLISRAGELTDGGRTIQRLSLIVSELQEDVMKTRMQPVEQLWSKLPRVVRDLAKQFGKEVNLTLNGGETELDRSVLEAVKDPLTHLVRNAMDHGIEAPDVREGRAKPRAAVVKAGLAADVAPIGDIAAHIVRRTRNDVTPRRPSPAGGHASQMEQP
jgi:two-component system chemotaxis sensor kinase CheA